MTGMHYLGIQSSSFRSTIKGLTDDEQRQLSDVFSSDYISCSSDSLLELNDSCLACCKWENNQSPSKEFDRWTNMSSAQKSRSNTDADACTDCAQVCNSADCDISEYTTHCTNNCLIDTPNLSSRAFNSACADPCFSHSCDVRPCEASAGCSLGFDHVLQCCTDNHSNPTPHASSSTSHSYQGHNIYSSNYGSKPYASQPAFSSPSATAFNTPHSPRNLHRFSQQSPFPSRHQLDHYPTPWATYGPGGTSGPQTVHNSPAYMNSMPTVSCLWAGCSAAFWTIEQLVYHVNITHLQPHGSHPHASTDLDNGLSCLWDNCDMWQAGMNSLSHDLSFDQSFTFDSLKSIFSNHILHDHLGIPMQHNPAVIDPLLSTPLFSPPPRLTPSLVRTDEPDSSSSGTSPLQTPPHLRLKTPSSRSSSPTPTPSVSDVPHDCSSIHHCQWKGCKRAFNSCTELTEHLSAEHVGSGQSRYHCYWEGCNRHDGQGFTSKQKILRHLQSHTGHRPFQCKICSQNFSEAATLQQHMRRHTQERPYVCDFPGCGKAFAITGALTIHKRTHNGQRPFKCSLCEKAFAESSNLAKHMRTHTGDRPYRCGVPGCDKAFARPDQLTRHMNVHSKK